MKVALTGYPNSGRSTIFVTLCDSFTETSIDKGRLKVKLGSSKIEDHRVEKIAEIYNSPKITLSEIQFNDFEYAQDTSTESKGLDDQMIAQLKMVDALVFVVRGFIDESIYYRFDTIDPLRDAKSLESDMIITDMASAEKRMSRLEVDLHKGKKDLQAEYDLIFRINDILNDERPLRLEEFTNDEMKTIRGFEFLTLKKGIVLINADDDGNFPGDENEIREWAHDKGLNLLVLRGKLQAELKELDEEDKAAFMEDMGVGEPALVKFIKTLYKAIGIIHFFTAGDTEARSWTLHKGSTAYDAAGVIHTDFQTRFIRAEVMKYDDIVKYGSEKACKEAGVYKSEKREYIVQDGDIIFFRHN
ncbi:DUF933 domain-containing protein [bacterium]|nr:DUF933 domain-containing protein [bacterium]MBU1025173.1 DUF933 domain-containing protein [bacterium]